LQISLFLPEISLLPKIISLLIFAGNLLRSACGTVAFCTDTACKSPETTKFPVNFPVSRELQVETGSYLTAHTTKLSRTYRQFELRRFLAWHRFGTAKTIFVL
jgi:hypothetical protein